MNFSYLFLRFIRLFVTSQMANAPLRTAPLDFFYIRAFITVLSIHSFLPNVFIAFFHEYVRTVLGFVICFHFGFEFSKNSRILPNFLYNIC